MSEIIDFPGLTTNEVSVEKVCDGAKDCEQVLILGWKDDEFYMAASRGQMDECLVLTDIAHRRLMDMIVCTTE